MPPSMAEKQFAESKHHISVRATPTSCCLSGFCFLIGCQGKQISCPPYWHKHAHTHINKHAHTVRTGGGEGAVLHSNSSFSKLSWCDAAAGKTFSAPSPTFLKRHTSQTLLSPFLLCVYPSVHPSISFLYCQSAQFPSLPLSQRWPPPRRSWAWTIRMRREESWKRELLKMKWLKTSTLLQSLGDQVAEQKFFLGVATEWDHYSQDWPQLTSMLILCLFLRGHLPAASRKHTLGEWHGRVCPWMDICTW